MNPAANKEGDWQTLDAFRQEIEKVDAEILALLSRRQEIASKIGTVKRSIGIDIIDHAREQEVLRRLTAKRPANLSDQAVRAIFTEIISAARAVQHLPTVAYLGPEATFSHQAAVNYFGHNASFQATETIEEVFAAVERGSCDQGVVPIENSYEGSVGATLDLFYRYHLKISAEIFLRIRHHLLTNAVRLEDINRIYSHPMPVAQCRSWLSANLRGVPITEVASTSAAARKAATEPGAAALGSRLAAGVYGLGILVENIEDHSDNITRFLIIGKNGSRPTGTDRTSILFFLEHKPGTLYRALKVLAEKQVNMTRIESRPTKTKNWEYLFFVDIEGHEHDPTVGEALEEMQHYCSYFKRLGSYPVGGEPWD